MLTRWSKRIFIGTVCLVCVLFLTPIAAKAAPETLGEIPSWRAGELRTTPLVVEPTARKNPTDEASARKGTWLEREYRNPQTGERFRAIYIGGPGTKRLRLSPQNTAPTSDGPYGSGATYAPVEIGDEKFPASLETHPLLGVSLAIRLADDKTLTLESQSMTADRLIAVAEIFCEKMREDQ